MRSVRESAQKPEGALDAVEPGQRTLPRPNEVRTSPRRLLAAELDPRSEHAVDNLARFLAEAQRLPGEAQTSLATLILEDHGQPLARLVDLAYPPGSEQRLRLGRALVQYCGGKPLGLPPRVLEMTIGQALVGFARVPAATQPPNPGPGVSRAPAADRARASTWSELAPSILEPRLRAAGDAQLRLEGKVELARTLLSTVALRSPHARLAVEQASTFLEKAQIHAGLARILLRPEATWAGLAPRAARARREVAELRPLLYQVHEVLARLARRSTAIRPTPGEIGDLDRAGQAAREALSTLQAVAEVLLDLAGRAGVGLTPGDLRGLGLAYVGGSLPPQIRWNEESVAELAQRRAGSRRSGGARAALTTVSAVDVLLALKASGLELAQVDPGQLRPAAGFVGAASAAERPECMGRVVDAFHVLVQSRRGVWSHSKMANHLAGIARVPTRAFLHLPETEVLERFHEVVRALNLGSGPAYTKIGPYHLTVEADENGHIARVSRRKHGALFRATLALGRGGPLTLTTLRHYRATAPLGRLLTGSLDTGESLSRSAFVRLASAGATLLRSAAARHGAESAPLDRASRELADAAIMNVALNSYRSAERGAGDARRALASALSSANPAALARAKRHLEAAEEAKRSALREGAAGLLRSVPAEAARLTLGAPPRGQPRSGALARTEQPAPTDQPATTGASLRGLALQLRHTRSLVERVKQTASDLQALSSRPGVPERLRKEATASAAAVEEAIQAFRLGVGGSDDENATQAVRFVFEQRVMSLAADHQRIHLALAALVHEPLAAQPEGSAPPGGRKGRR